MASDLELIKQLQKEIGIKLKSLEPEEIVGYGQNGFYISEKGSVTGLNLDKVKLAPFPPILSKFQHLEKLSLDYTGTTDISFLKGLVNLTVISLSSNKIKDYNPLQHLIHLTRLDLNANEITDISFLQSLRNLANLDLRDNKIKDILPLRDLSDLTHLVLRNNEIKDISPLQGLTCLISLDLRNNKIKDISPLKGLGDLTHLVLRNNEIKDISPLQGLTHLISLDLRDSKIKDISPLRDLSYLNRLDLRNNEITDIFPLQDLTLLISLDLRENEISDISFIQGLNNLQRLYLGNNEISDISSLQNLKNLTILDLAENNISKLPKKLIEQQMRIEVDSKFSGEWEICIYGNPLEKPPVEIVRKGREAISTYFKSLESEKKALNEVKVLLVGDGAVGKTSLTKRLLGQKFDKNEPQTHGINIKHWVVNQGKEKIKTNIWDFGGQEIMHATHQFFLSKRSLYILVLDSRRDEKIEYWLKHVLSFGGDSPVLVVINKIDENPAFDVNRPFLEKKYNIIKGFFRVSCATGKGIENLIQHLTNELAEMELIRTIWGHNWFNAKIRLEKMTENFISYEKYKTICKEEGVTDKVGQDTLLDFLNDLGVILHFKDFNLKETYVLDPKWITTAVYKIINYPKLAKTHGLLNLKLLDDILRKEKRTDYYYPLDKYRYIIDLMQKFELCYSIDDETVLIPDLLEVPEPHFDFNYETALKFIFLYEFLPRSVVPRFIVNMHKDVKSNLQWRTGVVLEDNDFESTAVIKADHEAKRIYIYVNGVQKRDYFAAILATLRRINRSFEKLKTTELIPMPDDPDITVSYKHLIRLEEEGIEFYLPGESEKKYRVKDLLGSIRGEIEEDETLQMLKQIQIAQMQRKSGKKNR